MCRRCNGKLQRWLGSVLDDTARLDVRIPTDYGWEKESSHHKVTGSPALIRLDVAALTDPRSSFIVRAESSGYSENRNHADDSPPISIPTEVCMWARMFSEEQQIETPVDTMAGAVAVLSAWWETLLWCPWVDEFYTRMAEIRRQLDSAHGVERRKPMGSCFTCEAPVYSQPGSAVVQCRQCGRKYDGMEQVKLEIQRRREASA
jgi:ribosomal protein L37AE/L43A